MNDSEKRVVEFLGRFYISDLNLLRDNKAMIREVVSLEENDVLSILRRHKVLQVGIKNIQTLLNDDHSLQHLFQYLQEESSKLDFVYFPEALLRAKKDLSKFEGIVFKGAVVSQLYPDMYLRDQGDIDILTRSTPFELSSILESFEVKKMKMHINVDDEIFFTADFLPKKRGVAPLDVHSYAYYLWGGMSINLDDIDVQTSSSTNLTYNYPTDEYTVLFLVAHSIADWTYRMRDLNDLYLFLSKGLDCVKVNKLIKKYDFGYFFLMLLSRIDRIYDTHFVSDFKLNQISYPINIRNFEKSNFGNFSKKTAFISSLILSYKFYNKRRNTVSSLTKSIRESINLVIFNNRAFNINHQNKTLNSNSIVVLWKKNNSLWIPGGYHDRVPNRKNR